MLPFYNSLLKLVAAILLFSFLGGCNSILPVKPTKPNEPYPGPYPLAFNEFAEKSPLLAQELAKLPEFQDGISEKEAAALENFMKRYDENPDAFNKTFEQVYKVGIPEVRKFCSPLQAFFWLSQRDDGYFENVLKHYNIKVLAAMAWEFYDQNRWNDPGKVIDRLNAPELFDFWFASNFTYNWSRFWITTRKSSPHTAEITIKTKKGICQDAAYLAYTCLKRAGYDATGLNVYFTNRTYNGAIMHTVCIFKVIEDGEIRYYKIADTNHRSGTSGPYRSIKSVAEAVAGRLGVSLGTFQTGVPEYNFNLYMGTR